MNNMQQWYEKERYKQRFLREIDFISIYRRKVQKSHINCLFFGEYKHFVIYYLFEHNDKMFLIQCTYPVLYPKVRISVKVFEVNEYEDKFEVFNEGYHNSNGVLCLLNHYPNQWDEEYGIEFIINRVKEWFEDGQYDKSNIVPMNYNIDNALYIFPEPLYGDVEQSYGIFEYCTIHESINVSTGILLRGRDISVEEFPNSFNIDKSKLKKGIVIFTTKPMVSETPVKFSEIKSYLNCFKNGVKGFIDFAKKNEITFPIPLVVIFKNHSNEGQAFTIENSDGMLKIIPCRFTYFRVYEDIFKREKDKDDLEYLRNKKVGLVGLGAVGSVIATELTRSGVGSFVLVDYDKLEIQNIGRHDLTLKDVDKFKVDGIKEKILDINPKAKCYNHRFDVLDDYSFNLFNLLSCDLVISTMDNQEAKYAIDSTLVPYGKKVIFAGAFYNSVAGFVLVSDKKMGCFKCISQHLDYMAEKGEIPDFSDMVPQHTEYNCGIPTFPGGSINTHTISLLTARVAIDTLLGRREVNEKGEPFNLYLVGNEKIIIGNEFFFEGYMDVKKFVLPGVEGCEICDREIILSEEEKNLYNSIMEKLQNDNLYK